MMIRFYLGLVSISFVAATTAWSMGHMAHEDFAGLKRSTSREIAPVPREKHFVSRTYSHSAPAAPSLVPGSPKTPKNSAAASEAPTRKSPEKRNLESPSRAKSEPHVPDMSRAVASALAKAKVSVQYSLGSTSFERTFSLIPIDQSKNPEQKS